MMLSVIVPVYKVEKYLSKCIDSILAQSFTDYELILVDDGSPDRCPTMCDEYIQKDSRIKVIHQINQGLSAARNTGIESATGDYIAFIDSDDYINKNMFSVLLQNAIANQADISVCSAVLVDENAEARFTDQISLRVFNKKEANLQMIYFRDFTVNAWNKIYRRSLFNSIRYPVGMLYEDLATTYKLIDKSERIVVSDAKLYAYVQRNGSIMNQTGYMMQADKVVITDNMISYFSQNDHFTDEEKKKILAGGINYLMNDIYKMASSINLNENTQYTKQACIFFKKYKSRIRNCNYISKKNKLVLWLAINAPWMLDNVYGRLRPLLVR